MDSRGEYHMVPNALTPAFHDTVLHPDPPSNPHHTIPPQVHHPESEVTEEEQHRMAPTQHVPLGRRDFLFVQRLTAIAGIMEARQQEAQFRNQLAQLNLLDRLGNGPLTRADILQAFASHASTPHQHTILQSYT
jgi:hypothetical protein